MAGSLADLPHDLVGDILRRAGPADAGVFASVCRLWRDLVKRFDTVETAWLHDRSALESLKRYLDDFGDGLERLVLRIGRCEHEYTLVADVLGMCPRTVKEVRVEQHNMEPAHYYWYALALRNHHRLDEVTFVSTTFRGASGSEPCPPLAKGFYPGRCKRLNLLVKEDQDYRGDVLFVNGMFRGLEEFASTGLVHKLCLGLQELLKRIDVSVDDDTTRTVRVWVVGALELDVVRYDGRGIMSFFSDAREPLPTIRNLSVRSGAIKGIGSIDRLSIEGHAWRHHGMEDVSVREVDLTGLDFYTHPPNIDPTETFVGFLESYVPVSVRKLHVSFGILEYVNQEELGYVLEVVLPATLEEVIIWYASDAIPTTLNRAEFSRMMRTTFL